MSNTRISALDGWRGIAILLVLIDHTLISTHYLYSTNVSGAGSIGEHGVTVFFVLSGYLITSRLLKESQIDLRSFYIKRFFRLMPAAWTYLAVCGLMGAALNLSACLMFYRNFVPNAPMETSHFWSLSVEEQFYFMWPVILVAFGARRSRLLALVGAVAIAMWRISHWNDQNLIFATQYRADAILIGCASALWSEELRRYLRSWMIFPLLIMLAAETSLGDGTFVPLRDSVTVALLMLLTVQFPDSWLCRVLNWRHLVFIGTISYSIYLWQQAAFFMRWHGMMITPALSLPTALFCAVLSYKFIEKPCIKLGARVANHAKLSERKFTAYECFGREDQHHHSVS